MTLPSILPLKFTATDNDRTEPGVTRKREITTMKYHRTYFTKLTVGKLILPTDLTYPEHLYFFFPQHV